MSKTDKKDKLEKKSKLDKMSIGEIERYGYRTQDKISDAMGDILAKTKTIEVGDVGDRLNEVAILANKATKGVGKRTLIPVGIRKVLGRYDSVENKLLELNKGIEAKKNNLDVTLDCLLESKDVLEKSMYELKDCEDELSNYIESIKDTDDVLRLQAATNRLKTISTLKASTEQSMMETVMLIQHNKEVVHQLDETVTNVVPLFRMQLINALSIKAHKDALDLREEVTKVANKMIKDNARNIQKASERMIENRKSAVIDPESLIEANNILQDTIRNAIEASSTEADANMEVINKLKSLSTSYQRHLKYLKVVNEENAVYLTDSYDDNEES